MTAPGAWAQALPEAAEVQEALQRTMVERCQKRWTRNFVPMAKGQLPATDPVNDESKSVALEVVLDKKGKVVSADVATPSGATALDEAAREIALDTGPYPKVDERLLSDDGNLHVAWLFERQDGRCDDVQVRDVHLAPELAIPTLLAQARHERAWERLMEAVTANNDKAVTLFARHWLKLHSKDKQVGTAALAALAQGGDREAATQLAAMAEAGKLPPALWPALVRAGQAVCPVAKKALGEKSADARLAALRALGMHFDKACVSAVAALASNVSSPTEERVLALHALGGSDADEARAAAKRAMDDPSATVRAAAMRSWAQPDTGRRALFAFTPLLKDPSGAVRAAAHAGVARSSGDKGLEQLYLVHKEKDVQVFEALCEELGQMNTEASAEMLKKFLRRDEPRVRRVAALALARRSDKFAQAAMATLTSDADPNMKILAAHALPMAEAQTLAGDVVRDAKVAAETFAALLQGKARLGAAALLTNAFPGANKAARVEWLAGWLRSAEPPANVASSR